MEFSGWVLTHSIYSIKEKVEKLNRKAKKLGCDPLILKITDKTQTYRVERAEEEGGYIIHQTFIMLTGETPKLAGWKLLGILDHQYSDSENFIKTVPGEVIPDTFKGRLQQCDHCGHSRYRSVTFIIEKNDGTIKQVGSTCIKDFLGHNPAAFLFAVNRIKDVENIFCEDRPGSGTPYHYDLEYYLANVSAAMRVYGWMSRSNAQVEMKAATADLVLSHYTKKDNKIVVVDDDRTLAKDIITYFSELKPDNDYQHNICLLAKNKYFLEADAGYAASMVISYKKAIEKKNERNVDSEFWGTVGDNINLNMKLIADHNFNGYWGVVHIYIFENGKNIFVWKTSKWENLKQNSIYNVKGKVKEHTVYNNKNQTLITKCKIATI
jgi:hypothetical protein